MNLGFTPQHPRAFEQVTVTSQRLVRAILRDGGQLAELPAGWRIRSEHATGTVGMKAVRAEVVLGLLEKGHIRRRGRRPFFCLTLAGSRYRDKQPEKIAAMLAAFKLL